MPLQRDDDPSPSIVGNGMERDNLVLQYIKTRDNFVQRIAQISTQLNAWTDEHTTKPTTLSDIAQFEGLRAERSRLLSEFVEVEDRFVLELLQRLSTSQRVD